NNPIFYVELGYNYALQNDEENATVQYNKALASIEKNPSYAYRTGEHFRKKSLLDYAVKAFQNGIAGNPKINFNLSYSLASIYGEMGDIEKMYETYLQIIERNNTISKIVKRRLGDFIVETPEAENNIMLKKVLLKKIQTAPNVLWNDLLSWLFVQQKQFGSAFIQEKAIYKRSEAGSLNRITELGLLALGEEEDSVAREIFEFALKNTTDRSLKLEVHRYLLQIEIAMASQKDYQKIEEKFTSLFNEYGYTTATIPLQTVYARFLVFQKNQSKKAVTLLKEALKLPLNPFEEANVKMVLGDILVYQENFNQALIYYAQIQKRVKNDLIAQTARFKTAQTSFYKGDFKWAETQLKVLKSSTSQLIANDALQLKLLISDNAYEDSTQTALKLYAKADLLAYQNKNNEAVALLDALLKHHKGEAIEDETLLKQAQLLEKKKEFDKAEHNYLKIITFYSYGILMDDALFALAQLYENELGAPEKAKRYYEQLIFEHQDSIYFVTARKKYRSLRGDMVN
ncbi:MAG: tetratricopeptide repeat protein, partial [Bacteroidota bacterium]